MKLALIIPAILAVGGFAYYVQILGSENTLIEMFPDHDPKLVIRGHREILKETLNGQHANATDDELNELMLKKLHSYTK